MTRPKMLDAAMACTGKTGFAPEPVGTPFTVPAYAPPRAVALATREALLKYLDALAIKALR